ncbi:hypothetical protein Tco_1344894 [Tanacetum coccineum]
MRTRSQARRRRQPQVRQTSVESSNLEKPDNPPIVTMADNRSYGQFARSNPPQIEASAPPVIQNSNLESKSGAQCCSVVLQSVPKAQFRIPLEGNDENARKKLTTVQRHPQQLPKKLGDSWPLSEFDVQFTVGCFTSLNTHWRSVVASINLCLILSGKILLFLTLTPTGLTHALDRCLWRRNYPPVLVAKKAITFKLGPNFKIYRDYNHYEATKSSHREGLVMKGDVKLSVIIAKDYKDEGKAALLKVLKSNNEHRLVLSDIKGVSPGAFCTHKILMEKDMKPAVQVREGSLECVDSFNPLKRRLTEAPILIAPDWDLPFELMCDARFSQFALGQVIRRCVSRARSFRTFSKLVHSGPTGGTLWCQLLQHEKSSIPSEISQYSGPNFKVMVIVLSNITLEGTYQRGDCPDLQKFPWTINSGKGQESGTLKQSACWEAPLYSRIVKALDSVIFNSSFTSSASFWEFSIQILSTNVYLLAYFINGLRFSKVPFETSMRTYATFSSSMGGESSI